MLAFAAWYLILTLLGWLAFPLVHRLFPALADRGYSLSRAAGLLIWAYVFWLCTSLGLTENNVGGILFALLPLAGLSAVAMGLLGSGARRDGFEAWQWLRHNLRMVLTVEVLFFASFAGLALLRAGNPTLDNAEKPMELMFINSILRSPSFPPHDAWLSGYAISYYYFGYVMAAMLAQLSGITGSVAHNLMTALVFGLAAIGSYGLLYDLLAAIRPHAQEGSDGSAPKPSIAAPLLAPLFLLLVSNLEGFLEVLHRLGLFWTGAQNFWTWLNIKDLNEAPVQPLGWIPDRFWWWWRASRVISDFDLAGNFREVIDEFPFFSFLHADLHPHVLAIPFNLLAIAIALNIFLEAWRGEIDLFGVRLKISPVGFAACALTLGGLAFLNTWDILVGAALILLAYVLVRVREEGWSWMRLGDAFALGIPLAAVAILLYLPFHFGFSSQVGGILPNLDSPTRGAQLWVMFAPLFIPLLAYLLYLWRGEPRAAKWGFGILITAVLVLILWGLSWGFAELAVIKDPALASNYLSSQGISGIGALFQVTLARRLTYIGGLLSMLVVLAPAMALLIAERRTPSAVEASTAKPRASKTTKAFPATRSSTLPADERTGEGSSHTFVLLLILIGSLLVLTPEFLFLRDQFSSRLNTIFKFYYQTWLLWSLAAAFGIALLLRHLRGFLGWLFSIGITVLIMLSLFYPALAIPNKTNGLKPPLGWTLDDFRRIQVANADEAAAILWLKSAPDGVVTEAVGGSYSEYGRISEYTGQPAVLGWPGHESQWRGTYEPQGSRQDDIKLLYETPDWPTALNILKQYGVRYVYVGALEKSTYAVSEDKFKQNLITAFQQGSETVYQVP